MDFKIPGFDSEVYLFIVLPYDVVQSEVNVDTKIGECLHHMLFRTRTTHFMPSRMLRLRSGTNVRLSLLCT